MPTKYKILLGKGALPPYRGPAPGSLQTPLSQTVLPTIQNGMTPMHKRAQRRGGQEGCGASPPPIFDDSRGKWAFFCEFKTGGSMESLVEMVQIENSLGHYVNFILENRLSLAFKTLKPMSFRGFRPLDPWCHDGIANENSTNWQFSAKLHVNFTPPPHILPSKTGFLGLKMLKPMSFRELNPWTPDTQGCGISDIDFLWIWYKLRIHYKIACEFYPQYYPHKRIFL